jgi:hypothetical protein
MSPIPSPEGACSRPPGSRGEGAAPAPVGARQAKSPGGTTVPIVPGVSSATPPALRPERPMGAEKVWTGDLQTPCGSAGEAHLLLQRLVRRSLTPRPVPGIRPGGGIRLAQAVAGCNLDGSTPSGAPTPPQPLPPLLQKVGGREQRRTWDGSLPLVGEGWGGGAAGVNASPLISRGTLAYGRPATTRGHKGTMASLTGKLAIVAGAAKGSQIEVRQDQ